MRLRLLLFFLLFSMGFLRAQDTIRTLIISEARIDNQHEAYCQFTNVGNTTIDLSQFEFGLISQWTNPYHPDNGNWLMLPKKNLAPGQSFVLAKINDWTTKMWAKDPVKYQRYVSKPEMLKLCDMQVHIAEAPKQPDPLDSVSPYQGVVTMWGGTYMWYLRHHVAPGDSVVVDQVNGVFTGSNGYLAGKATDVAGFTAASANAVLVRKNTIKKGNVDFASGAGSNPTESEWMAIPFLSGGYEPNRAVFWTVGHHGDYHLKSLTSSVMTFNADTTTLTVPWGVRNDDSIMYKFNRVPGIGWHYDYGGTHADSAYVSVRSGDKLTLYACGDKMEKKIVTIVALASKATDNLVIPMKVPNNKGFYTNAGAFCDVTDKAPVIDTIRGIDYACRKDSLLKYLEMPTNATFKFTFVDGVADRADLKKGDILEITSADGSSKKQYYIKPNPFYRSHDAYLSSITWPDIDENTKGHYGWAGDTVPNFSPSKLNYIITSPLTSVPALVAKTEHLNAKVDVTRALNLTGSTRGRTITFKTTAEDDTSKLTYNVQFVKEQLDASKIQPYKGEPFISQYVFKQDYNNYFCEIVNPGTEVLDLSNYMMWFAYASSAADAITNSSGTGDWATRYRKYIFGKKWVDQTTWSATPARVINDPAINPRVLGGDVFVMAFIDNPTSSTGPAKSVINQIDIEFKNNPWGEDLNSPWDATMRQWTGLKPMLFKILNDSVKNGLKAATDPKDFKLLDVMGSVDPPDWKVGGISINQVTQYVRKPEIYKGNPVIGASFGTNEQNSEWIMMDESRYAAAGYGWPATRIMVADGIGSHFMYKPSVYLSTIVSDLYQVSDGYSNKETIKGVLSGTTVNNFLANIAKVDTGQHLKVKKVTNGSILTGTDLVSIGDTLIVVSSDSANTSKYTLIPGALSNDARLTSTTYTIAINGSTGTVSKFDINTKLATVVAGVVVPAKATFNIIDMKGAYVSLKALNFDTTLVDVKVSDQIKFEVTAEDNTTKIVYQLQPDVNDTSAYLTSTVYSVDQGAYLISFIPNGSTVASFVPNLIPAAGATINVYDKNGLERTFGSIFKDDKVVVTAKDGKTTKTYYLSMLGLKATYLAFVTSNTLAVDQLRLKISGKSIKETLTVSALIAKLTPASGATIKVKDKNGAYKAATANLAKGDVVEVTSGDGSKVELYAITMDPTSVTTVSNVTADIQVYPNPTSDLVYVSGVNSGDKIGVYSVDGKLVRVKVATRNLETVSLGDLSHGIYFVKVVAKGKQDVSLKLILK